MDDAYEAELYRNEGAEFRSVRLEIRRDGSLRLDCQDIGDNVKRLLGDDDYEFWVDVHASELRKLAFALLRDKYANREGAVNEFRDFCDRECVEYRWMS
jgi:hypothetical protein